MLTRTLHSERFAAIAVLLLTACPLDEKKAKGAEPEDPVQQIYPQDPIVFVHGCPVPKEARGSGTNYVTSTVWKKMYDRFVAMGYPAAPWIDPEVIPGTSLTKGTATEPANDQYLNVFVYRGATCGSNIDHAHRLAEYVEEVLNATGARRVDLIANSLGAIPARLYVLDSGGSTVRDFVILAGANHGSAAVVVADENNPLTQPPAYEGAREIFPAYDCDPNSIQYRLNGCVVPARRDGRDETPFGVEDGGPIAYLNIYNAVLDELIVPAASACLNQHSPGDCLDPVNVAVNSFEREDTPHGAIRKNAEVIERTVQFVMRRHEDCADGAPCTASP